MSNVNFVDEFTVFMRYAASNQLTGRERLLWVALFTIANSRAVYNAETQKYDWPGGFIPIPNNEMSLHSTLDKRGIESVRNQLKQRGLIDFHPGFKNKRPAEYKLNYLSLDVGHKIVPNNAPNNAPKDDTNNAPKDDTNTDAKEPDFGYKNAPISISSLSVGYGQAGLDKDDFCCCGCEGGSAGEKDFSREIEDVLFDILRKLDDGGKREVRDITDKIFSLYAGRKPMTLDYAYAAFYLGDRGRDDVGNLAFAFKRAFMADKPGHWDYIIGILNNQKYQSLIESGLGYGEEV